MTAIDIRGLTVAFGDRIVLRDLQVTVPSGGVTAIVGPSGCGKTTALRVIAGLLRPDSGSVTIGDTLVDDMRTHIPPERRRVGIVPQEGALFPHLDVFGNVAFGLKGDRAAKVSRVKELLNTVGLPGAESLRPQELSGGMQQRVAVARSLSMRPDVVLLDEPFSALDAGLRDEVRADVLAAIRSDGATAVLVTHDQEEALSCADLVGVMRDGCIVQIGTPAEIYSRPVDLGVARFVGSCVELAVTRSDTDGRGWSTALGPLRTGDSRAVGRNLEDYVAVYRPEQLEFFEEASDTLSDSEFGAQGVVVDVRFQGHSGLVTVQLDGGHRVVVRVTGAELPRRGVRGRVTASSEPRLLRR